MALAETETWQGGFIRDDSGNLVVTTDPAEEVFGTVVPGFLTDGDGRLVATYEPDEDTRTVVPGFVTDTSGRLAIASEVADPVYTVVPGFATDSSGYLSTQEAPSSGTYQEGFVRDTDGALGVGATYVASPYEEAVLALSPTLFLPLDSVNGLANLADTDYTATGAGSITVGGATPGPLNVGDAGATTFDGSDDRITTDYGTRRNLSRNPTAGTNTTTWSVPRYTLSRTSEQAWPGDGDSNSIMLHKESGTGQPYIYHHLPYGNIANTAPAAANDVVSFSFRFRSNISGVLSTTIYFYNSGASTLSSVTMYAPGGTSNQTVAYGADEWVTFEGHRTAPANTAGVGFVILCTNGANEGVAGNKWYADGAIIEVTSGTSAAGTYFDGSGYVSEDTGEWVSDPGGHVGWAGTAHASASDRGCYANGCDRTYMGWAYRDASADADTLVAADIAAPPTLALNSGDQDVLFKPENSTATTWSDTWPDNGEWVHWALVFEEVGNDATLYINGVADASTNAAQFAATNADFMIGAYNASTDPFDGNMAFVSVHEEALSEAQIQACYAAGS